MGDDRTKFADRVRRVADDLENEIAAMPARLDLPPDRDPWAAKTPTENAHRAKASHVTTRMEMIGEWLIALVESGSLDDSLACDTLEAADRFRADSATKGDVPKSRGYVVFWYFLREWLPQLDDEFNPETDGNVGLGNLLFPLIMVRNIRRFADAVASCDATSSDIVQIVLDKLPRGVADKTRQAAKLLAEGKSHNVVNDRLGIGVDNSKSIKSRYVAPHTKAKR